jgi:hypothetical protein
MHLQRLLWSMQIVKSYDPCQSSAVPRLAAANDRNVPQPAAGFLVDGADPASVDRHRHHRGLRQDACFCQQGQQQRLIVGRSAYDAVAP